MQLINRLPPARFEHVVLAPTTERIPPAHRPPRCALHRAAQALLAMPCPVPRLYRLLQELYSMCRTPATWQRWRWYCWRGWHVPLRARRAWLGRARPTQGCNPRLVAPAPALSALREPLRGRFARSDDYLGRAVGVL